MAFKVPSPNDLPLVVRNALQAVKEYVDLRNLRFKQMTTAERDAMAAEAGMVIYNTTTSKHQGYNGTAWWDFY